MITSACKKLTIYLCTENLNKNDFILFVDSLGNPVVICNCFKSMGDNKFMCAYASEYTLPKELTGSIENHHECLNRVACKWAKEE